MTTTDDSKTLQTTTTSIEVLEILDVVNGARVSEIATRMDKPKSTIHGHLATLKEKQFVVKKGDLYFLGPELLRLGSQVRTRESGFVLARQFTEQLFEKTGLRSVFVAEMGGKAVILHTASGNKMGWAHEQIGNRLDLHDTAVGKAILAELPNLRVEQIIDQWGLTKETENTITTRETLFEELRTVRDQGYAVNHAENFKELYAIGVAATKRSGGVIGGFSVTGPEHSITGPEREDELASAVTDIANEFELELALA
ncbi:IclR family transcriptional regulator [Haloferax sp. Atlit-4N]|uniref:IclR family transcriptional regulator n=1 Tax=Haloferax sp. Atlit-4N TaxID=2077206 RepID=UPI000E2819A0|nr:IclR family transcriptional regulator [Haloferax sp. Atlit-4N]RDZ51330.1 IclR family transcriptional regulator [Haloferax sp. Atlit-4N]